MVATSYISEISETLGEDDEEPEMIQEVSADQVKEAGTKAEAEIETEDSTIAPVSDTVTAVGLQTVA